MKVMKFGGGCLKDHKHFLQVAEIINSEKDTPLVVVSAVSGITDLLEEGIQAALDSEKKVVGIMKPIRNKHEVIANASIQNGAIRNKMWKDIEIKLERLERLLYGVSYTGEVSHSIKAHILSFGERLSAIALSGILKGSGRDAIALEADKIGIITDESFESATARLSEVRKNLKSTVLPFIYKGVVPIITGYFGCTHEGKVTTFGRNGSDYSAAVVAYGLSAPLLEIWKDVDGFMSADPKIVKNAHRIDKLSYYEAAELSYFGAHIIHPRTVEPLVNIPIPIYVKNLYKTESKGTQVLPGGYEKKDTVKSVTYNRHISVLRIHGPGVGFKPGIIAEIGRILSDLSVNIYSVITAQTCINLLIDKKDSQRSYDALKKVANGIIDKVDLAENIALIAVVGEGLLKRKGLAARVLTAVAGQDINIEMMSSGASEVAYYFIVKDNDLNKAVNAIHQEFFKVR